MVTNPIPANQIVNVNLDWLCINPPTCTTLELSLQNILNAICDIKEPSIETNCITGTTLIDVLNDIIAKICTLEESNPIISPEITEIIEEPFNITTCTTDNWDINSLCCIDVDGNRTEQIQAMYSRFISMCEVIKSQDNRIGELETKYNTLQLEVDNINTNCC